MTISANNLSKILSIKCTHLQINTLKLVYMVKLNKKEKRKFDMANETKIIFSPYSVLNLKIKLQA